MQRDDENHVREFVTFLAQCERRLGDYILTLVPNWADAEDIAQQVKLRLWEQFDKYDASKDFGAWACTIAYYEVMTYRTLSGRNRVQFSPEVVDRISKEADSIAPKLNARISALQRCIDKLTQWQRELLIRCCVKGESVKDVAFDMNRKVDSTRKAILRIRRELFHCVEEIRGKEPTP